uniref:NADH-ubiquinone oxidoreductase chain 4L n=1 Tax=Rhopalomyia pomum TaxID=608481 RepID=C7FIL3_RHOPM|nr:NADH dehydrogenase subunit 4L [Rhopalomyia pomum]
MYLFMFICGMIVFLFNYKYLLINLLSIEYMMLMLLFSLLFNIYFYNIDFFFHMMFMTFMVAESVIGISLFISMIRNFGNNNIFNFNNLKF